MSMMKPVDNHTTSMGIMEIMGSRTGRFRRNDSVQPLVLRPPGMVHFFAQLPAKNLTDTVPRVAPPPAAAAVFRGHRRATAALSCRTAARSRRPEEPSASRRCQAVIQPQGPEHNVDR